VHRSRGGRGRCCWFRAGVGRIGRRPGSGLSLAGARCAGEGERGNGGATNCFHGSRDGGEACAHRQALWPPRVVFHGSERERRGSTIVKVVPSVAEERTLMSPPWASTICLTMYRPRPRPLDSFWPRA